MKELARKTRETNIEAKLLLYGSGTYNIDTSIGFFNHMLETLSKHARFDLELKCIGDIKVDFHHSVEDCGIVLGKLVYDSLFPIQNIERFGNASVVMDEACVECDLDISNRGFLFFDLDLSGKVGDFDCELVEEFFKAFSMNSGISIHIHKKRGKNNHHIIEATFKSFAVALRRACVINHNANIPSTKGIL